MTGEKKCWSRLARNLKLEGENWKVRLIEEDFMKRMWDVEGV